MNPYIRIAARFAFFAIGGFLVSLQSTLPGISFDDVVTAINAGYILGTSYLTVGFFTDLEPTVGIKGK